MTDQDEIIRKFTLASWQCAVYRAQPVVTIGERGGVPQSMKNELRERRRGLIRDGLRMDGYPLTPVRE